MEKILEIIRRLRKRYPLWTLTDGTNHLVPYTKYAYEKVCKHGLGMPVAMLAAHEYLASMSISDPGGTEESKAAYQCLLQNMKSIDYIEQKKSNLPAVVTRCQQVEFMAMRWIQVDRSKKRFELAFMKAHLISGLVFLDPLRCPNNQNGMPNVAPELMRELMNLSPKRARAEQSNKVLTYLEEYNNTFPFQTLVNKFMYD
ncbi:hypothetical protein BGZ60DRAFT_408130 [Tricladium varicosporioides]|nr:hypothetical protein BGZ60DRAFT_408130 [Hymenoscyphus varicosporioides]